MTIQRNPMAYCVICVGDGEDVLHIFSSPDRRTDWAEQDADRTHVFYDYVVNEPDLHEKPMPKRN